MTIDALKKGKEERKEKVSEKEEKEHSSIDGWG